MIKVTRLNGTTLHINHEMIEFIEQTPDTVISMVSGKKLVVAEEIPVLVERIIAFKRAVAQGIEHNPRINPG